MGLRIQHCLTPDLTENKFENVQPPQTLVEVPPYRLCSILNNFVYSLKEDTFQIELFRGIKSNAVEKSTKKVYDVHCRISVSKSTH